jgi:hypothetical protein
MIDTILFRTLHNPEYLQYMTALRDILVKYGVVEDSFACLYDQLVENVKTGENALIFERRNVKVAEKNEFDRVRDLHHSRFYSMLKFILMDENDERYEVAQAAMRIVREAGNPRNLPENAQSAVMTALGRNLEHLRERLHETGLQTLVDTMMEANADFIRAEKELRTMKFEQGMDETPRSMTALRRQNDPIYRAIIAVINAYSNVPSKRESCIELIAEINVLVARYNALLLTRRRGGNDAGATATQTSDCETCG